MSDIFINFTNHPSEKWSEKQIEEAGKYGVVMDIPFPAVSASEDAEYAKLLALEYVDKICKHNPTAVLCQGEFTVAYAVTKMLKDKGICVLAACSERQVEEKQGTKLVHYVFERFREYPNC